MISDKTGQPPYEWTISGIFEVLMVVTMKKIVFECVIPYSLVQFQDPEDGGNIFLQTVDKFLPNYPLLHPGRLYCS
jgi:hypothetical protein